MSAKRVLLVAFVLSVLGPITAASAYDSDGDGVDDRFDVCCATPSGTSVDEQGRPMGDFDGDCDVDLLDFAVFQGNFTGELVPCPACNTSDDCSGDYYCSRLIGECHTEGTCNPSPLKCPDSGNPICGCDGVTYESACFAALAGESVDHDGACPPVTCLSIADCDGGDFCEKADGDCDGFGTCQPLPFPCMPSGVPVCSCDGVTYSNRCIANLNGKSVDYEGECEPPSCQTNAECDSADYCAKADGDCDGMGLCEQRPAGCIPGSGDNRVCGCDEVTYEDSCFAHFAGVNIADTGPCPP